MLSWGAKRRFIVLAIAILIVVLIFAWYGFAKFYAPPSCTDGKQNQEEIGVDCGGPCVRICENQAPKLIVHWQRAFMVRNGSFNALAYVENTNPRSGSRAVSYSFKLYDADNILVAERIGTASIPPQRIVPIFEGDIRTGSRSPARTVFSFEGDTEWVTLSAVGPDVQIVDQNIIDIETLPLLTARLVNNGSRPLSNVEVVAVLYDSSNNAREASQTVIPSVAPLDSAAMLFSWPSALGFTQARIEIIPRFYPGINY